jgi:hypothetical protein
MEMKTNRARTSENLLTCAPRVVSMTLPMARMFTADSLLQGRTLSSFGAHACEPEQLLGCEETFGSRDIATRGEPGNRW